MTARTDDHVCVCVCVTRLRSVLWWREKEAPLGAGQDRQGLLRLPHPRNYITHLALTLTLTTIATLQATSCPGSTASSHARRPSDCWPPCTYSSVCLQTLVCASVLCVLPLYENACLCLYVCVQHRRPGGFLVRISENRFGYTLSYRVEDRCRHYIVEQDTRGHYALVGVAKVRSPLPETLSLSPRVPMIGPHHLCAPPHTTDLQQHQRANQLLPAQPHQ